MKKAAKNNAVMNNGALLIAVPTLGPESTSKFTRVRNLTGNIMCDSISVEI